MVDVRSLQPGDKIRIVSEWPKGGMQNCNGLMDKYLGQILTVKYVDTKGDCCRAFEDENDRPDGGGWYWHSELIDTVVVEESEDFEPAEISELMSFLGI